MRSITTFALAVVLALGAGAAWAQDHSNGMNPAEKPDAANRNEKQATLPLKLEKGKSYVWTIQRGLAEADVLGSEEIRPEGSEGQRPGSDRTPVVPKRVKGEKLRYELKVTESSKDGSTVKVTVGAPSVEPQQPGATPKDEAKPGEAGKPGGDMGNRTAKQGDEERTLTVKLDAKGEIRNISGENGEDLGATAKVHRDYLELILGSGLHDGQLQPGKDYEVGGTELTLQSPGSRGMNQQVKFKIAERNERPGEMPVNPNGEKPGGMDTGEKKPGSDLGRRPDMSEEAGHAVYDGENGLLESFVPAKFKIGGPDFKIRRLPTTSTPKVPDLPESPDQPQKNDSENR